ncbi:general substrate transporter [Annulohypoxylon truncatum]|uniref:general substrate transporter n=1 Tax=Annulohypoxylon truncatum TaxID=327061 RepID=UPI0020082A28|nr:general substrate transporter [Annulohypoxylon truncatum]KAI1210210.1 general substrate transporter [Annulohypoxylon truncatum]
MQLTSLLQKPSGYILASVLCSLGGFLFGIDTGIIGPVTVMNDFTKYAGNPSPTIHGLIVSSILIPAAISSFFAGRVADALGRPLGIAIGSFIFGTGAALEGASVHIAMFIVGRVVEGIGEGLYLSMMVVYICEISPPRYRGALTTAPQLLTTLGLVTGFFTCYGTANMQSSFSWRLPFILLAAYSGAFSASVLMWLPPSPRWLTLHGKTQEASAAWDKLGVAAADREKILDQYDATVVENAIPDASGNISAGHVASTTIAVPKSKKAEMLDVLSSDARPRLILAVFLMGMQQLSGIDGVLYYAPLLFQQAGLSSNESTFLASGVSAILIFGVTIPATIFADRWGRRLNTILGGLGMTLTMFLMGALYASSSVHAGTGAGRWVVIVCIYAFAVIYCVSWAVGIKVYAAEIQPQRTRASATSIAHGSNWLSNFLVALVTPTLLAKTSYGAYFLFGGCTLLTAAVCWVFMPETRGMSLGEIDEAFVTKSGLAKVSGVREWARSLQGRVRWRRPVAVDVDA